MTIEYLNIEVEARPDPDGPGHVYSATVVAGDDGETFYTGAAHHRTPGQAIAAIGKSLDEQLAQEGFASLVKAPPYDKLKSR